MIQLTTKNYTQLIKGASILTTGGGLSYKEQVRSIKSLHNFNTAIKTLDEFPQNSYLVTVAEAGRSDAPPIKKNKIINQMLSSYEMMVGKHIAGIYPFEIGQESITLESAHFLKLPVADFDTAGCRAVPFFDINVFNLKKIPYSFSPLVLCTDRGEIFLLTHPASSERTEEILREMVSLSSTGIVFFIGGLVKVEELIRNKLSERSSYSKAFQLGGAKNIDILLDLLKPRLTFKTTVVSKQTLNKKGFLCQKVQLLSEKKEKYTLFILNETIKLTDSSKKTVAVVPEKILMIDEEKMVGVSSEDLESGKNFRIAVVEPEEEWKDKRAEKIFGKDRFPFFE